MTAGRLERLELRLRPSRQLAWANTLLHALTAAGALAFTPRFIWPALLLIPIAASFLYARRSVSLGRASSVVGLVCRPDGSWRVDRQDGQRDEGRLLPTTVVSARLVILMLRISRTRRTAALYLPVDALDSEQHRQLRARLRLAGPAHFAHGVQPVSRS